VLRHAHPTNQRRWIRVQPTGSAPHHQPQHASDNQSCGCCPHHGTRPPSQHHWPTAPSAWPRHPADAFDLDETSQNLALNSSGVATSPRTQAAPGGQASSGVDRLHPTSLGSRGVEETPRCATGERQRRVAQPRRPMAGTGHWLSRSASQRRRCANRPGGLRAAASQWAPPGAPATTLTS
jgi:hypothetical protein